MHHDDDFRKLVHRYQYFLIYIVIVTTAILIATLVGPR